MTAITRITPICQLCTRGEDDSYLPAIAGDVNCKLLIIVGQDEWGTIHGTFGRMFGDVPYAETPTVRCSFDNQPDNAVQSCAIYTRAMTIAFSHFIVTRAAYEQNKVLWGREPFEHGKMHSANIGIVLFCETVLNLCHHVEAIDIVNNFIGKKSSKILRKNIFK